MNCDALTFDICVDNIREYSNKMECSTRFLFSNSISSWNFVDILWRPQWIVCCCCWTKARIHIHDVCMGVWSPGFLSIKQLKFDQFQFIGYRIKDEYFIVCHFERWYLGWYSVANSPSLYYINDLQPIVQ